MFAVAHRKLPGCIVAVVLLKEEVFSVNREGDPLSTVAGTLLPAAGAVVEELQDLPGRLVGETNLPCVGADIDRRVRIGGTSRKRR